MTAAPLEEPARGGGTAAGYRFLLIAIVVLTLGRIVFNDFLGWDDNLTIYNNPKFNHLPDVPPGAEPQPGAGPTIKDIASYWLPTGHEQGLWIPATYTVWGVLANLARLNVPDPTLTGSWLNPALFHAASLLAHVGTTLVAFALLRRVFPGRSAAAFFGAVLYGVHPVQVETVAWASGLKDVMCGMFAISSAYQYLRWTETKQRRRYALAITFFILGMLSKPTAMITPVLAAILDLFVARRDWRAVAKSVGPWFVLSAACAVWTKHVQPAHGIPEIPLIYRPLLVTDNLAFYLYKLVWPARLCIDYGRRPPVTLASGALFYTWPVPLAAGLLVWFYRRRFPQLVPAALLFVAGVLPVLGLSKFLFQFYSAVADHYLYISMVGPAMAVALLVSRARATAVRLGVAVVLVALSARSFVQAGTWSDDVTFFSHVIAVNPESSVGHNNLGMTFDRFARVAQKQNDYGLWNRYEQLAMQHIRKSVEVRPDYSKAWDNYGFMLIKLGQVGEGIEAIKKMLETGRALPPELRGRTVTSSIMLGQYFMRAGDFPQAIHYLNNALEDDPGNAEALALLAEVKSRAATRPAATSRP